MAGSDVTQITYRYEKWRALAAGVLEAAATIFLLLIAVRWYEAGPYAKALVAGGGSVGLLLAPWLMLRSSTGRRSSRIVTRQYFGTE
jgi:hypothetical protein